MRILVSGASGLIGRASVSALRAGGHNVVQLVRRKSLGSSLEVEWNSRTGVTNPEQIEGFDAIVHLAGENIAGGRWTEARKTAIRESRVNGTQRIVKSVLGLKNPPRVFLCASAIGYYGDCGDAVVDESGPAGAGFLAEVCTAWEAATAPLNERGIRTATLRFGVVLSGRGGALKQMLIPFKIGLGGRIGAGRQYMSWISFDDAVGAVTFALFDERVRGPINVVSPDAATNAEFTKALGRALRRPTLAPMPAFVARLALGEMADALLLASTRVAPRKLLELGYTFKYTGLDETLRAIIKGDTL